MTMMMVTFDTYFLLGLVKEMSTSPPIPKQHQAEMAPQTVANMMCSILAG